jgi:hypothetical protein
MPNQRVGLVDNNAVRFFQMFLVKLVTAFIPLSPAVTLL